MSLTARQAAVLQCIRDFSKRGYSPRLTEIARAVGLRGDSSVELHVKTLERLGNLRQRPKGQHRSIALAEPLKSVA